MTRTQNLHYYWRARKIRKPSDAITKEIKIQEAAADSYFEKSITYINILIGIRVVVLVIIGIIIFNIGCKAQKQKQDPTGDPKETFAKPGAFADLTTTFQKPAAGSLT